MFEQRHQGAKQFALMEAQGIDWGSGNYQPLGLLGCLRASQVLQKGLRCVYVCKCALC